MVATSAWPSISCTERKSQPPASKWVANHFGCVSLTLEMPFKDNANLPDEQTGWSGARSKLMGAAMLNPVLRHLCDDR